MTDLRPSRAHLWTKCAAAPLFESRVPSRPDSDPEDDDARREGTCAAWVADCVLKGDATCAADLIGRNHANGWLVEPDMAEHVQGYIDIIKARGGVTTTEQYVTLCENPKIAGTLDVSTSIDGSGILCCTDLKYGFRIVEVFENPQLIIYTGAELRRLNNPAITRVSLEIYQPRAFHPDGIHRKWVITTDELYKLVEWVIKCAIAATGSDPVASPGRHCADCNAVLSCKAFSDTLGNMYETIRATGQRQMTGDELGRYWLFVNLASKLVSTAKSAVDAEVEARLKNSEYVKGVSLQQKFGHRKFTVPDMMIQALSGKDPYKKVLMSPAELEKAGVSPAVVNSISKAPSIGFKLSPYTPSDVGKAFMQKE